MKNTVIKAFNQPSGGMRSMKVEEEEEEGKSHVAVDKMISLRDGKRK